MNFSTHTKSPAQAVGTPDNSTGTDGDGGRTAGTPSVGVGATGAIGSHPCEIPLHQVSPGVPDAPTTSRRSRRPLPSRSTTPAQSAGPSGARVNHPVGPAGVAGPPA